MRFTFVLLAVIALDAAEPSTTAKKLDTPSEALNEHLPKWVRLGFEHRFRVENYSNLKNVDGNDDHWFLNRVRMNVNLIPTSWWSFTFQGQDARIFAKENPAGATPYINRFDLRLAFTDFGDVNKGRIAFRAGRQELAYGDERLIGIGNWGATGRSFDAVKLVLRQGPLQLDLFAASVVVPLQNGISHHVQGSNVHGAYLKWKDPLPNQSFEPFFFWRVGTGKGDIPTATAHLDRRVSGFRMLGQLPRHFDYVTENVYEAGSLGNTSISAYSARGLLRYTFADLAWKPRIRAEYFYASGDGNPGDGKSGTYDQLYPTPHENTGLADQVGFQNLRDTVAGFDFTPWRRLNIRASGHDWRLAQTRDGVYLPNGNVLFRDPSGQAGSHIGSEVDVVGHIAYGPHYITGGYGHLFPGEFLKRVSPGASLNYVFLNVGYRF